jgi:hypothetical protein
MMMKTTKKLFNVAKRYLVEGEQIIFINQFGEKTKFKQINDKIEVIKG